MCRKEMGSNEKLKEKNERRGKTKQGKRRLQRIRETERSDAESRKGKRERENKYVGEKQR